MIYSISASLVAGIRHMYHYAQQEKKNFQVESGHLCQIAQNELSD
jgi:hypothetical protein